MTNESQSEQESSRSRIARRAQQQRRDDKLHRLTMALSGAHGYTAFAFIAGIVGVVARGGGDAIFYFFLAGLLSASATVFLWTSSRPRTSVSIWAAVISIMVIGSFTSQIVLIIVNVVAIALALWLNEASKTQDVTP